MFMKKMTKIFLYHIMLLFILSGCSKSSNKEKKENDTDPPTLISVTGASETYGSGDLIVLTATFNEAVSVSQDATLTLDVGGTRAQATLSSSGSSSLTHEFTYTVKASYSDDDGIEVTGFTGTIQDKGSNNLSDLDQNIAISGVLIDSLVPTLNDVTGTPGTYGPGVSIVLIATFNKAVRVSKGATLTLDVGDTKVSATLSSRGSSSLTHEFTYTVEAFHSDDDGIEVTGFTGTIRDRNSNNLSDLDQNISVNGVLIDSMALKLNTVTATPGTYGLGDAIVLTATFDEAVTVSQDATLTLDVGGTRAQAPLTSDGSVSSLTHKFTYTVEASHNDLNGIEVTGFTGTIQGSGSNNLSDLGQSIPLSGVLIDNPPTLNEVTGTPRTYGPGDSIVLTTTFDEAVSVSKDATLTLDVGGTRAQAKLSSGSTSSLTHKFTYTVEASHNDPNGIEVTGFTGTIQDGNSNNLSAFQRISVSGVLIDSPPTLNNVTGTPGVYGLGASIVLTATFSEVVTVSQGATLTLDVGGTRVSATLSSDSSVSALTHKFTYTVEASHSDDNGITVTGFTGTIQDEGSNNLSAFQDISLRGVLINSAAPTLNDVTGTSGTYGPGDLIVLTATFNKAVTVSQGATLTLDVGSTQAQATLSSDGSISSLTHKFTYTVGDSHNDDNGIEVTGFTGTIQDGNSNNLSDLGQNIPVNGVLIDSTAPTLNAVTGTPGTYGPRASIVLTATFSEAVTVSQGAHLTLDVGNAQAQATLSSNGSISLTHEFTYTVDASHNDADGIEVTGVTGTIQDEGSNNLSAFQNISVNGVLIDSMPPTLNAVTGATGTYGPGTSIVLTATFNEAVTVSQNAHLTLDVGNAQAQATLSSNGSSSLTHEFTYTVDASHNDADGIEVTGLTGTIQDGDSNDLSAFQNIFLRDVIIDSMAPMLNTVTGTPGTYGPGTVIVLTATFNEAVSVSQAATLLLNVGGTEVQATLFSNSSVFSLTHKFTYTVGTSLSDSDGIEVTGFTGTIQDGGSNNLSLSQNILVNGVLIDNTPGPQAVASRVSGESGSVKHGEVVDVLITFDQDVVSFEANDITVSDGVKSHFVMSTARKYWISVTAPDTGSEFSVSVADGVVQDGNGKFNIGSQTLTVPINGTCTTGGAGETDTDPIIICTYQGLKDISNDLTKHYRLGGHINARASWFEGITNCPHYNGENDSLDTSCSGWSPLGKFKGSLDGDNFEIRNFYINSQAQKVGFFSDISEPGSVKNLHLRRIRINKREDGNNRSYTGALAGDLGNTSGKVQISNCSVTGKVTSLDPDGISGGLVGYIFSHGSIIANNWTHVSIQGKHSTGGLIGRCGPGCWISSSHTKGEVNKIGTLGAVGGLVGSQDHTAEIQSSYSHANISGQGRIGGLAGDMYTSQIYNSYSTGTVTTGQGHGFLGRVRYNQEDGTLGLRNNFWDTQSSGRSEARTLPSDAPAEVEAPTGLTTSEMQQACTSSPTTGICVLGDAFEFTAGEYPKVKKCTTCYGTLVFSNELVGGQ